MTLPSRFDPPGSSISYWGEKWGDNMGDCRILTLCFAAAMADAGDL